MGKLLCLTSMNEVIYLLFNRQEKKNLISFSVGVQFHQGHLTLQPWRFYFAGAFFFYLLLVYIPFEGVFFIYIVVGEFLTVGVFLRTVGISFLLNYCHLFLKLLSSTFSSLFTSVDT
jgi:hypothetical protein